MMSGSGQSLGLCLHRKLAVYGPDPEPEFTARARAIDIDDLADDDVNRDSSLTPPMDNCATWDNFLANRINYRHSVLFLF